VYQNVASPHASFELRLVKVYSPEPALGLWFLAQFIALHLFDMTDLGNYTAQLHEGADLSATQAASAAALLADPEPSLEAKKAFLVALAEKGESPIEVTAFAQTFRGLAVDPGVSEWADAAIDVCGTGGDGSGTFNISTAVAFVLAAAGVPVFKHGNRSITSKCGSADLMEALGIRLEVPHEVLRESLRELNFCFFFAPNFHPAFKEVMPVRKALAAQNVRTIFNLLGPLINPGRPAHQLLGVFSSAWVPPLAEALGQLGLRSALVAHGSPTPQCGLDELSCAGTNHVAGCGALSQVSGALLAADAGLPSCEFEDLAGGDAAANLATLHALMSGAPEAVPSGLRDSVLFNAGAAFWVAGRSVDLQSGVDLARMTLESGAVANWLQRVGAFYASI
jgi:anthranilate phosphoribosyltransferase